MAEELIMLDDQPEKEQPKVSEHFAVVLPSTECVTRNVLRVSRKEALSLISNLAMQLALSDG